MYLIIENFNAGMDTRRMALTSHPGTLQMLRNAHITRGGEIEKRKAYARYATLPNGTFGLQAASGTLYVFGSIPNPAMPPGVSFMHLEPPAPGLARMTGLIFAENFNGKVYAIAEFDDGNVYHYYNGQRVTAWDAISAEVSDAAGVASVLARRISMRSDVTATANGNTLTVTATEINAPFSITASAINGGVTNDQTATVVTTEATEETRQSSVITIGGTFEIGDSFIVVVNEQTFRVTGSTSGAGRVVMTFKKKMYSSARSLLYFCEIDNPMAWSTVNGGGYINMSNQDAGSEDLTALATYQSQLAVFSSRSIQTWVVDPDPVNYAQQQVIRNSGTLASRSIVSMGSLDTLFLNESGIRSLRARDASNAAMVSDVGTAIDTLVIGDMAKLGKAASARAVGVLEPNDGRFWLAMGSRVYVLSYFPTPQISAWSVYEPGFEISDFATLNGRVYARSGDVVYLYGGIDGNEYDACEVEAELPWIDAGKPAHTKTLQAFDMVCEGKWKVYMGMDTSAPEAKDYCGTVENSTYALGSLAATGVGTHIGVRLVNQSAGYARIGNFMTHFHMDNEK